MMIERRLKTLLLSVVGALLAGGAGAECTRLDPEGERLGETIRLVAHESVPPRVIEEAVAMWESCPRYGSGFPVFTSDATNGTRAARTVVVRYEKSRQSAGDRKRCGSFSGSTIVLYGYVRPPGAGPRRCGSLAQNLAHELGHALGLEDAPRRPACAHHIMADLTPANLFTRRVTDDACRAAGELWLTPVEAYRLADVRAAVAACYPSLSGALCD